MTKQRLDEARQVQEKETLYYSDWEYGVGIQSMIDSLTHERDQVIEKGAIPDTIRVEMETHYGYYDDRTTEWVLHYARMETQKEIDKRVKKTERDRENARKSRAKAKIEKEQADEKEYERLKEKYENGNA